MSTWEVIPLPQNHSVALEKSLSLSLLPVHLLQGWETYGPLMLLNSNSCWLQTAQLICQGLCELESNNIR